MRNFIDGAADAKHHAEGRLAESQAEVMELLNGLRRLGEALKNTSALPNAKDFTTMRDELEYKKMQGENARQTKDRLKVTDGGCERWMRAG